MIVVATIAILAAIAIPNFLEAQVRAKVARTRSDIATVAHALQMYQLAENAYPPPADATGVLVPMDRATDNGFDTRVPPLLTTPVPYLTALPIDPFSNFRSIPGSPFFHYATREYITALDPDAEENLFDIYFKGARSHERRDHYAYFISSGGPDLSPNAVWDVDLNAPGLPGTNSSFRTTAEYTAWVRSLFPNATLAELNLPETQDEVDPLRPTPTPPPRPQPPLRYDPTNGTTSGGDLIFFGPDIIRNR